MARQDVSDTYGAVLFREDGVWQAVPLPAAVAADVDDVVAAVRSRPGDGGSFALVDVAHEFFVVVRVVMGRERLLLSDATAASSWDLAGQVVDRLEIDLPDDAAADDLEVEPVGDLGVFDDLGMDERELGSVVGDLDAYADEMLSLIAGRLGFGEAWERVVDALDRPRPAV